MALLPLEENLPEGPHAIHHAVVNPESRVARRGEEITTRVTTIFRGQQS
jgi:hypothetical protein